jgi:APA family basic amino acid/polyamine antiporter
MFQLPAVTWWRFVIWLAIGLVFYFMYGYRHSRLRRQGRQA